MSGGSVSRAIFGVAGVFLARSGHSMRNAAELSPASTPPTRSMDSPSTTKPTAAKPRGSTGPAGEVRSSDDGAGNPTYRLTIPPPSSGGHRDKSSGVLKVSWYQRALAIRRGLDRTKCKTQRTGPKALRRLSS